jgi:dTDP-4-amino-4,6-dideoxygalactose transaminase
VHHHPLSSTLVTPTGGLPRCDSVYEGLLSLPLHPGLSDAEQEHVISSLDQVLHR